MVTANINTIILLKGEQNLPTKDFLATFTKGDSVFGVDTDAVELARWDISQKEEAMKKLAEYKCSYISGSGTTWVEEYALEFCECDEDGDFISGSDFEIAL